MNRRAERGTVPKCGWRTDGRRDRRDRSPTRIWCARFTLSMRARCCRYALHLTSGDRQRAEDIVQETLLRAWLHPDAIAERPARPWLFAVARNLAVDAYRARRARPHEVGEAALELIPAPDEADRALESWAVADALKALRPEHRGVLLETYYRGQSVAEAAVGSAYRPGTVKSRTFYALRALKLALEERGLAP